MNEKHITTNSLKAWFLAARPKTLSGAAVPVLIGMAFAYKDTGIDSFQILPAILCLLFAWVMQIDSNFINDYFDCIHGNDNKEKRLGPQRACSEGWITLKAMEIGIAITTVLGCFIGLPLIIYGGIEMILVGAMCVLFAFLYTTKLSYLGLGDLLVLVFFGIVPVCLTYYVIMPDNGQTITLEVFLASISCGLVIDTLLLVNNYRDRDNDKRDGKNTLVVRIGEKATEKVYYSVGIVAALIMSIIQQNNIYNYNDIWIKCIPTGVFLIYFVLHTMTWRKMKKINHGKELNKMLGQTSKNMIVFGILESLSIVITSL